MKIQWTKCFSISLFFFLFICAYTNGLTIEKGDYKLEIIERSGRFKFYKKNAESSFISLFSDSDSRTSAFSVFENSNFYKLGDSSRYKKNFNETNDGGSFIWTSDDLIIEQDFNLDNDGFLEIAFSIKNISDSPQIAGLKFLLDTAFEDEDYFYLVKSRESQEEIISEYELTNPDDALYWTSAVRNASGVSLMAIPTVTSAERIIFGNRDILNTAGFDYSSTAGREFSNPPYSINDNAVLYLYSPVTLQPQKERKMTFLFRAIDSVENYREIIFRRKRVAEDIFVPDTIEKTAEKPPIAKEDVPIEEEKSTDDQEPKEVREEIEKDEPAEEQQPIPQVEPVAVSAPEITADRNTTEKLLDKVTEIKDIIESISRPGIITEENLSELEELIKKLEDIGTDEN